MKRYKDLYNFTYEDIRIIYKKIRSNTKNKLKIKKFEDYYSMNIANVKNILDNKSYSVGRYNIFLIKEPKRRIIMSQSITDKLINHLVAYKILLPVLDRPLINTNIATRVDKGTHYGIKYLKKYLNELKGKKVYALKFDISKYFYNIDHDILINLLKDRIKDKDALDILTKIITSTDSEYVNKTITNIKAKEIQVVRSSNVHNKEKMINEINRLPMYKKGKGLPIGNMTSQIFAIFYLNELDHFIKETLHIKHYIRYMDDGVLLSDSKEYLKYCLEEIKKILCKYQLKLNDKTKIIYVNKEGIDFLGFRFYIIKNKIVMKVRNDCKKRFKRKVKLINDEQYNQIINSYRAHFKWGNCHNLFYKYNIKNQEVIKTIYSKRTD